ncbi:MAG: hypothetical protein HOJ13_01820 [Nitrospina sp.]|jgi:ABC-type bacteriocin/lantibiotic exporter with double-glycine peptidase domain|nr:hypothetical protein [Nitrospina sp.]
MKPVVQEEKTGCGLACVATLAEVSYGAVKKSAYKLDISSKDPKLWSGTDHIRTLCATFGIKVAKSENLFQNWDQLPDCALLAIKWHKKKGIPFWHWTVFVREEKSCYVLDPKHNLKTNQRTDFGRVKPKWFIEVFP